MMGYRTPLLSEPLLEPDRLPGGNIICVVTLVGLEDLGVPGLSILPHAYVEMRLSPAHPVAGNQVQRSDIKSSRKNPKWTPPAKFKFLVSSSVSSKIIVSVYHFNTLGIGAMGVGPPISLGDTVLHLKGAQDNNSVHSKTLNLQSDSGSQGIAHFEYSFRTPDDESRIQEDSVYEFQRWQPGVHWGHGNGFFLVTDPGRWATLDGARFSNKIDEVAPPVQHGWVIAKSWQSTGTDEDPDGWEYAMDFFSPCWFSKPDGMALYVRRRTMTRTVIPG